MPWVRVDDHFDEHPKMAAVGPVGWGVWLAGLAYCNRNLTDGFIPYAIAEGIGGSWTIREPSDADPENGARSVRRGHQLWTISVASGFHGEDMTSDWIVGQLVRVGLWEEVDGGYLVHDYGDYQPTKAQVIADREAKVAAGRAGGKATAAARATAPAKALDLAKVRPVPKPVPVPNTKPVDALRSARENGRPTAVGAFLDKVVLEDVIG